MCVLALARTHRKQVKSSNESRFSGCLSVFVACVCLNAIAHETSVAKHTSPTLLNLSTRRHNWKKYINKITIYLIQVVHNEFGWGSHEKIIKRERLNSKKKHRDKFQLNDQLTSYFRALFQAQFGRIKIDKANYNGFIVARNMRSYCVCVSYFAKL